MVLLVDTNVWVEVADVDSANHARCAAMIRANRGRLVVTGPVVVETAWFIEDRLGPNREAAFLRMVTSDEIDLIDLTGADWARVVELIETYADLGLGTVDASIIAVAERQGITTIATMNARDFRVVRPAHTAAFDLVP